MSGPLQLLPGEGGDLRSSGGQPPGGPGEVPGPRGKSPSAPPGWTVDPADALAERYAEQIAAAVHADEVAALLESDGLSADGIEERYGRPDLFSLAEDLYARVPRHYPEPPPAPDPWRPDGTRCLLRGLVFALPALAYVVGAPLWTGPRDLTGLVAAALLAWAFNQGLSHRAYARLATGGPAGAARTLRLGAPAGALGTAALGLLLSGPTTGGVFAAGQSAYLGAASVLLVLGRERALLAGLVPLAAGACVPGGLPAPAALVLLLGTVALTVAAAALSVRTSLRPSGPGAGGGASGGTGAGAAGEAESGAAPALRDSLPYGLFGLAAGVLAALAGAEDPRAVVVLTLSMGAAEWLLYRYRSLTVAALRASTSPGGFARRAGRGLGLCLGGYLLLLCAGALIADTDPAALLALGALLWTALLLQAFAVAWFPAAVALAAAVTGTAARSAELPYSHVQLSATVLAAAVLAVGAARLLGRPAAHR
ncbi:hypothetical protein [Streptomyces indicus]|uniref:Uncharacterized protein n=1 Tax=Streptomyces indicus TaxID=417292 RepID=A0A1G8XA86_9ACTN|nr:hypothetical protein [Streptomyces indicus]SDJ87226.1 hypothetical protein SAMN05421806_10382 [Streptomyces indicus]